MERSRETIFGNKKEIFLGVVVILGFLLPHSSMFLLLVNPILLLLLLYSHRKIRHFVLYGIIVVVPIVLSWILSLGAVSQKAMVSGISLVLYFLFFPFVGSVRLKNVYLYMCLLFIFISQVAYLSEFSFLQSFFDRLYPLSLEDALRNARRNITADNILDIRLGGLYHNANICAEFVTMLLASFIVINNDSKNKKHIIFYLISFFSILITGSRTGFITLVVIFYFGYLRNYLSRGYRLIVPLLFILFVFILITTYNLRSFDVDKLGSMQMKWNTFKYYLSTENSLSALLFGHFDNSLFVGSDYVKGIMRYFDCEYGDLVFRFGLIGFGCILFFMLLVYLQIEKKSRFFMLLLLWITSNAIISAYRASFVFLLLLSIIFANYNKKSYNTLGYSRHKGI